MMAALSTQLEIYGHSPAIVEMARICEALEIKECRLRMIADGIPILLRTDAMGRELADVIEQKHRAMLDLSALLELADDSDSLASIIARAVREQRDMGTW
jgi:hypothetical protein